VACALGLALVSLAEPSIAATAAGTGASATKDAPASQRVRGTIPAGKAKIQSDDPLDLKSSVALVVDQDTDEVLFEKNPHAVLPIASITKLMTALVTVEANLPLDEELVVSQNDRSTPMRSRLNPGHAADARQMLHLALMSSENRAAQLLGRTYPGGIDAFVEAMNAKAQIARHERHALRRSDRAVAREPLERQRPGRLVKAAYAHPMSSASFDQRRAEAAGRQAHGALPQHQRPDGQPDWDIGLQKTGYISAAGRCLVMQAVVEGSAWSWCCSTPSASIRASAMRSASASGWKRPSRPLPPVSAAPVANAASAPSRSSAARLRRPAARSPALRDLRCASPSGRRASRPSSARPGPTPTAPRPACPESSRIPAAMQRTPSSSSSLSRA
jgi:D-alanyl-D-alanine endopeptidase (penicillin-binding protein 7)